MALACRFDAVLSCRADYARNLLSGPKRKDLGRYTEAPSAILQTVSAISVQIPSHSRCHISVGFNKHCERSFLELSSKQVSLRMCQRRRVGRALAQQGGEGEQSSSGSEPTPESLFMKELRKRGLSTDFQEEVAPQSSSSATKSDEQEEKARRKAASGVKDVPRWAASSDGQTERSRRLNSEGLEGFPARAWELLKLGGAVSIAFGPLTLILIAAFVTAYLYFGSEFIHQGHKYTGAPTYGAPSYIEPYQLLQDEMESSAEKFVPFRQQ